MESARLHAFLDAFGLDANAGAHMGYFTVMETPARNFPGPLDRLPLPNNGESYPGTK